MKFESKSASHRRESVNEEEKNAPEERVFDRYQIEKANFNTFRRRDENGKAIEEVFKEYQIYIIETIDYISKNLIKWDKIEREPALRRMVTETRLELDTRRDTSLAEIERSNSGISLQSRSASSIDLNRKRDSREPNYHSPIQLDVERKIFKKS